MLHLKQACSLINFVDGFYFQVRPCLICAVSSGARYEIQKLNLRRQFSLVCYGCAQVNNWRHSGTLSMSP